MSYYDMLLAKKLAGGGSSAPVLEEVTKSYTANGDDVILPSEGYDGISKVNVSVNVSGGGEAPENDVEFIDYDGTIVYSYTAQEFLALDAMPANPTHEGLTAQGWNWTLADAKEFVGNNGGLVIGQVYDTPDGSMNIYVSLPEGFLSPYLGICPNGTAVIDWGDGSPTDTLAGTSLYALAQIQHTYASAGDYKINVKMQNDGTMGLYGAQYKTSYLLNSVLNPDTSTQRRYQEFVTHLNIGSQVTYVNQGALAGLNYLKTVTMMELQQTPRVFAYCYALQAVVIPQNAAVNAITEYMFMFCGAKRVSLPKKIGSIFASGFLRSNIKKICINNTATNNYASMFEACGALETVISNAPIGGSQTFNYCTNLKKLAKASPSGTYGCAYCIRLIETTASALGTNAFESCGSLNKLTITSAASSIGAGALANCHNLREINFERTTPASVSNSNAFANLPTDCVIYVPSGSLSAYKTATNYPNPNNYTYVEY